MPRTLRVVTINFWGNEAPLEQRLVLAERQLAALNVDVVAMQEVRPINGREGRTTADVLAEALGFHRIYEPSLSWSDNDFYPGHPGGQEGLAILSRYPIVDHRATPLPEARPTEARMLLSARIETPAGPIWCHTTHLHYRLDDGLAREKQVLAVDEAVQSLATKAPQILCGDFNAVPDSDEMRFLRGLTTLDGRRVHYQDAFMRVHPDAPGLTWCAQNEHTRSLRSLDIDRRIDYIFVTTRRKDGRGTVLDAAVVLDERRDSQPGVVSLAGHSVCASDHYGVLAEIQIERVGPETGKIALVA